MPKINPGTKSPINPEEIGLSSVEQVEASSVHESNAVIRENIIEAIEINDKETLTKYVHQSPINAAACCFELLDRNSTYELMKLIKHDVVCENLVQLFSKDAEYSEESKLKMAQILTDSGYVIRNSEGLPKCIQDMLSNREKNASMFYGYKKYKHDPNKAKAFESKDGKLLLWNKAFIPTPLWLNYKEHSLNSLDNYKSFFTRYKGTPDQSAPKPHVFVNEKYGGFKFNLNGNVRIDKNDRDPLMCRHLVIAFLDAFEAKTHKVFLQKLKADNAVLTQKSYDELNDESFIRYKDSSVVVGNESFGHFIFDLQKKLQPGEDCGLRLSTVFKLSSTTDQCGHVMALLIEKLNGEGDSMVKVSIYDPNTSANLIHLERLPEHLPGLKITDFLGEAVFEAYADHPAVIASGQLLCYDLGDHNPGARYANKDIQSQVCAIPMALACGRSDYIRDVMQSKSIDKINHDDLKQLILQNYAGMPLLHAVLVRNHAPVIQALGQFLKDLKLDSASVREILTAKNSDGETALSIAIALNFDEAVHAFGKILGELSLTEADLKQILKAEAGPHMLHHPAVQALASRHQSAVSFMEILKQFNLHPNEVGCDEQMLQDILLQLNSINQSPSNSANRVTPTGSAAMDKTPDPGEKPESPNKPQIDTKLDFSQD